MFPEFTPRGGLAFAIGLAAALALVHPTARGQTQAFSASLAGVVFDSSGRAIPGAKVRLTSADRGLSRTFTTDSDGRYSFAFLPPANYSLKVEAIGFSTHKQVGITLNAGQVSSQSITMQVGDVE